MAADIADAETASRKPGEGSRPYHHGDLSRALIDAGRKILETDGPDALSLRAVAREAGVSPAAPYHHFKDKGELLDAVANEGWRLLGEAIAQGRRNAPEPRLAIQEIGVAYVCFARQHPALYRIMYRTACDREMMPQHAKDDEAGGWAQVAEAIADAGRDPHDEREMRLIQIAAWCAAHGVAEMAGFKDFESLKAELGGEEAFVRAVLGHVGILSNRG
ncbi:MAG TPA: TetR/AcrR family transcriptional regulator [Caulobacteraceae bacterium]|jgi:AcrR family transcriptional regulator|nr:TetR/AcrR family transcriptional regulator [Caulobacteraceae bacterium]